MKRSGLLATGTALALTVGACSSGSPSPEAPTSSSSAAESTATPRLQALASKIVALHSKNASLGYESKPPYTVGVTIPLDGGGQLTLSTQTPTEKPDAKRPLEVDVRQSGIEGGSFDATFLIMRDGLWTAICNRNDGQTIEEIDQHSYEINGADRIEDPTIANVILQDMLTGSENVVGYMPNDLTGQTIPPFKDVCAFNLGDGPGQTSSNA